jgi:hypothetical protein
MKLLNIIVGLFLALIILGCGREPEYIKGKGAFVPSLVDQAILSESGTYVLVTTSAKSDPDKVYPVVIPYEPSRNWIWASDKEFSLKEQALILWGDNENIWAGDLRQGFFLWEKNAASNGWQSRYVDIDSKDLPDYIREYMKRSRPEGVKLE